MFGEVVPLLAAGRQVIAVDLQAHGRTADIDRPISYEAMADDISALIAHLGLAKADLIGYSFTFPSASHCKILSVNFGKQSDRRAVFDHAIFRHDDNTIPDVIRAVWTIGK